MMIEYSESKTREIKILKKKWTTRDHKTYVRMKKN